MAKPAATTKYTKAQNIRYRKGYQAIPFSTSLVIGALGAGTVISADLLGGNFLEDMFILRIDGLWSMRGHTAGEGPLIVGYHHGALTVAQVAENLDANLLEPDNIISREFARRPVRRTGVFAGANVGFVLNNGNFIQQKVKFSVGSGHAIKAFVRNQRSSALTSGTTIEVQGTLHGKWQR